MCPLHEMGMRLVWSLLIFSLLTRLSESTQNQTFSPKTEALIDPDGVPSCTNETVRNYTTQAFGVSGFNALFISPETCIWFIDKEEKSHGKTFEMTNLKISQNGTCVVCQFQFQLYYIFQLLVENHIPLNFTEKTEFPPSIVTRCYTLYGQLIIFNGSVNFTFSCHFTGYPPVQSITWDLGYFNDYDCITYSEDNQTVTLGFSTQLLDKYSSSTVVKCTATNGIDTICGLRQLNIQTDVLNAYNALQSQSSGVIEMNSSHIASFKCVTDNIPFGREIQVCRVSDSTLGKCLNIPPQEEIVCCSTFTATCPWLLEDVSNRPINRGLQVTTNITGNYQCEGVDPVIGSLQPFGQLIIVTNMQQYGKPFTPKEIGFLAAFLLVLVSFIIFLFIMLLIMLHKKKCSSKFKPTKEKPLAAANSSRSETGGRIIEDDVKRQNINKRELEGDRSTGSGDASQPSEGPFEIKKRQICADLRISNDIVIDGDLIASMFGNGLLEEKENEKLISMQNQQKATKSEKADYFYQIVCQWSKDVFDKNMGKLKTVLKEHGHNNNQALAAKIIL